MIMVLFMVEQHPFCSRGESRDLLHDWPLISYLPLDCEEPIGGFIFQTSDKTAVLFMSKSCVTLTHITFTKKVTNLRVKTMQVNDASIVQHLQALLQQVKNVINPSDLLGPLLTLLSNLTEEHRRLQSVIVNLQRKLRPLQTKGVSVKISPDALMKVQSFIDIDNKPIVEQSSVQESFVQEPFAEEPFVEEPFIQKPIVEYPIDAKPFDEEPFVDHNSLTDIFVDKMLPERTINVMPPEEKLIEDRITNHAIPTESELNEVKSEVNGHSSTNEDWFLTEAFARAGRRNQVFWIISKANFEEDDIEDEIQDEDDGD